MKITNKLELPDMLVRALEKEYEYREKRYSITSLLDPDRVIMLKRRYNDEIEQDVSESIWLLLGTSVHYILEKGVENKKKENESVEEHLEYTFDSGYTLSGIIDHTENDYIDDYKVTSVWTVLYGSNNDKWKKQLQMGAYLYYKNHGKWIGKGRIIAILKDFNKKDSFKNIKYPSYPISVIEFDLGTPDEIEEWIIERFKTIAELEKLDDKDLPLCTMEDRFNKGKKYAVMKKTSDRAWKTFTDLNKARELLINLERKHPGEYKIEERFGEDTKCLNYCSCCKFCNYYLENYDEEVREELLKLSEEVNVI